MKRIKICFLQPFGYAVFNPNSKTRIGGAEVNMHNIAVELAKDKKFEVFFLTGDFGQKNIELHDNVKLVKMYSQKKSLKNYFFAMFNLILKLYQIKADVYITSAYSKHVGIVSIFCKIFGKSHIHRTAHDREFEKQNIITRIVNHKITGLLYYIGFLTTDCFIVQNFDHQHILKKNFNYPSIVIRNSYIIPKLRDMKKDFILWIARAEKWKRPELFIKLAKNNPDFQFVMIMPRSKDANYFQLIKRNAQKLDNLKFIPGVPFSEIDEYYQNAKILINTSSAEGFPNSFNQAMNYSTPIISLNINPDDFISKNKVGIYCNNNFNELDAALKNLFLNNELWESLSKNAYNFVKKEMNIKKSIKIWKKIILYYSK